MPETTIHPPVSNPDNNVDTGTLQVNVTANTGLRPVENAQIRISYTGAPDSTLEEVETNSSGQTEALTFSTPPLEYSMQPSEEQPYSEYTAQISADGFQPVTISGIALFSGKLTLLPVRLTPVGQTQNASGAIVIPANTLFGDFPPKIEEAEIKPTTESGEIVLSRVVIPEYIIVHDGPPSDNGAKDYYVTYRDYIKNVASSEIYATWPDATLRANILAIMSFTLNRVYTEWSLRIWSLRVAEVYFLMN